ncbi:MAG TPA: hypothetical protein VH297_10855 [Gaiellaceae bacterium]
MAKHDELLEKGPHEAPEPETAEQRSKRVGWGSAGGAVAAGGIAAAKLGGLGKVVLWLVLWHGLSTGWRAAGWIGLALAVAAIALVLVALGRRERRA